MSLVFLILGGNQGKWKEIFSEAIHKIECQIGQIQLMSSHYKSESWGFESEMFVNQIVVVDSDLSPAKILGLCQQIENALGRTRKGDGYEARTMDIDLLYYDSLIVESPSLQIPHPRIAQRRFVLVPLVEIASDFKDPVTGLTAREMLKNCPDPLQVWKISQE
jgi:2-amino-4-hydroxy-6-hydroxymethyldihydropteridine diphosphokinase